MEIAVTPTKGSTAMTGLAGVAGGMEGSPVVTGGRDVGAKAGA